MKGLGRFPVDRNKLSSLRQCSEVIDVKDAFAELR